MLVGLLIYGVVMKEYGINHNAKIERFLIEKGMKVKLSNYWTLPDLYCLVDILYNQEKRET